MNFIPYHDFSIFNDAFSKIVLLEFAKVLRFKTIHEHEKYVACFESKLAQYFHSKHVIAVDSGTTALQLTLTALGVGKGDEVIVPTYTYVATALAVSNIGAKPVFVDIKADDLTIDPELIEANITSKTKAIIPVHIHGLCCDIPQIERICHRHKIALIEDASQAHGASINGKLIGTFGTGCMSLHTSKNLGGIGDAGMITTHDAKLNAIIRKMLIPDNGLPDALLSRRTPCVMDALQAALILKKLDYLERINERKRQIASQYNAFMAERGVTVSRPRSQSTAVYRDYWVLVNDRDDLKARMLKDGIETKAGYSPLHVSQTFKKFSTARKQFPIANAAAEKILLLPSYWGMTDEQVKRVCSVFQRCRRG